MIIDLYKKMLLIRYFEEGVLKLFELGKLFGTTHAYSGQEANAVGVPVLAIKSDLGIDESLIYDNQNGFWVEECSSQALANKIIEAYNFVKKHREKFYNDCRKFVSKYDIHILGKQVELIYDRGENNE